MAFTGAGLNQLDPQRLYFLFDYAPRVYFRNDVLFVVDVGPLNSQIWRNPNTLPR